MASVVKKWQVLNANFLFDHMICVSHFDNNTLYNIQIITL